MIAVITINIIAIITINIIAIITINRIAIITIHRIAMSFRERSGRIRMSAERCCVNYGLTHDSMYLDMGFESLDLKCANLNDN